MSYDSPKEADPSRSQTGIAANQIRRSQVDRLRFRVVGESASRSNSWRDLTLQRARTSCSKRSRPFVPITSSKSSSGSFSSTANPRRFASITIPSSDPLNSQRSSPKAGVAGFIEQALQGKTATSKASSASSGTNSSTRNSSPSGKDLNAHVDASKEHYNKCRPHSALGG